MLLLKYSKRCFGQQPVDIRGQGYSNQLTRQIGEHLVVAKLGRLGILTIPFAGNIPDYDLLASDLSGHSLPLQVKTINGPSWQFSATSFLDIKFEGDRQVIQGEKKLSNPNLICVFVFLKSEGDDEFFILTMKDLQKHFLKNYKGGIGLETLNLLIVLSGPRNL